MSELQQKAMVTTCIECIEISTIFLRRGYQFSSYITIFTSYPVSKWLAVKFVLLAYDIPVVIVREQKAGSLVQSEKKKNVMDLFSLYYERNIFSYYWNIL